MIEISRKQHRTGIGSTHILFFTFLLVSIWIIHIFLWIESEGSGCISKYRIRTEKSTFLTEVIVIWLIQWKRSSRKFSRVCIFLVFILLSIFILWVTMVEQIHSFSLCLTSKIFHPSLTTKALHFIFLLLLIFKLNLWIRLS